MCWSALDNTRNGKKEVTKQYYSTNFPPQATQFPNFPFQKQLWQYKHNKIFEDSNYANIYVYIREENLPLNDFGKCKLKECDHGIKNPVSKPLLIINVRFSLNCPN